MIEIPDPESVPGVADWIELELSADQGFLSKAAVSSVLERTSGDEPSEALIANVWRELERRQSLYSRPFFRVHERTVEPEMDEYPAEYLACLLLSLFGVKENTQMPAKLFERLTCEAVKRYLSGEASVFGWPFEPEADDNEEETQIKQKIRKLAANLNERFSEAPSSPFKKDRGLDVIGWIPFAEKRSGQVVLLLQCAAGHNWKNKLPVPIDAWRQYIHWGCTPIIAFSVPSIINDRDWNDVSLEKGMLLDRVRLMNLLSRGVIDPALRQELSTWVEQQLLDMQD